MYNGFVNKKTKREKITEIKKKYEMVNPYLNERSRRIWAASEVLAIGKCGRMIVHEATGMDFKTIRKGFSELELKEDGKTDMERIRKEGGGRKSASEKDKTLRPDLEKLVEPVTRGDPESHLRWTCKSTRNLADALNLKRYRCSHSLIASELKKMGYSLQANRKTHEGGDHPDRNTQFEFINSKTESFLSEKQPVISVAATNEKNMNVVRGLINSAHTTLGKRIRRQV